MSWEFSVLFFFQTDVRSAFADAVIPVITHLGDKGLVWIFLSATLLPFHSTRKIGVTALTALLLGMIVGNVILKPAIARIRPYDVYTDVELLIGKPSDFSMPSGHTLSSFAAATAFYLWNRRYGGCALILAALIAVSRLYLFVHYPTDVLIGAVLGVLLAILARNAVQIYIARSHKAPRLLTERAFL